MRPLLLAVAATVIASAARAGTPDPMQEANDWRTVIMAAVRAGGTQDLKACSDCLGATSNFPACTRVKVDDLMTSNKVGECKDTCQIETKIAYDKIIDRMRKDPKCGAALKDPAEIKKTSEMVGEDQGPELARCGFCLSPEDLAAWPDRRKELMRLFGRLDEAAGKTDAVSRDAALAPVLKDAKAQFACAGEKIEPATCPLKR